MPAGIGSHFALPAQLTSVHSLHVAANRALHSETTKFKTYNLHTELVFLYAAHHNVSVFAESIQAISDLSVISKDCTKFKEVWT